MNPQIQEALDVAAANRQALIDRISKSTANNPEADDNNPGGNDPAGADNNTEE